MKEKEPNIEDVKSAELDEWNQERLAELVGLEGKRKTEPKLDGVVSEDNGDAGGAQNVLSQTDLFDTPQAEDPRKKQTSRSLAKKPLPKLGIVALGLFVVFGIAGLALNSMMKVKVSPSAPKMALNNSQTSMVPKKTEAVNKEGELKTQLAISKQADDLKAIDKDSENSKRGDLKKPKEEEAKDKNKKVAGGTGTGTAATATPVSSSPPPPPPPATVPYSPPPRRVYSPPPPLPPQLSPAPVNQATTTPRSETKPQTEAANLQTSTLSKPVESKSVPTPTPTSAPLDPLEQWNRLALIGSYSESSSDQDGTQDNRESEQGDGEGTLAPGRSIAGSRIVDEAENVLIPRVVPGTTATATLATPILWAESDSGFRQLSPANANSNQHESDQHEFAVTLTSPLSDVDGNEALRVGQQVIFKVTRVDSNGLVSVSAVSVVDEFGNERELPPGAITILGDGEKPLIAKGLFDSGSQIASMDLGMAGLGAVAKVGEILNRPKQQQQQSASNGEISTISTSTTGEPNLLGALMEGGANPVLESIQERNKAAIERIEDQKNAWFLPIGESVQIITTQPFDL